MTLALDETAWTAQLDGQPLELGARAFDVPACLARSDRTVSKRELLDEV